MFKKYFVELFHHLSYVNQANPFYKHEKLNVFQLSRQLIRKIYTITASYPKDELHGLVSQMRRASISVASNLVEGLSRRSYKEKIRFLEISYGSILELDLQLLVSEDLGYITTNKCRSMRSDIKCLVQLLSGLRRSFINTTLNQ